MNTTIIYDLDKQIKEVSRQLCCVRQAVIDGGGSSGVTSFNSRTGAVSPTSGDYTASQVTNAVDSAGSYSNPSWITALAFSKLTSKPTTLSGYGITDAQSAITLTTTGSSGSATLVSNTLNVPTYTLSGLGGITASSTDTLSNKTIAAGSNTISGLTNSNLSGTAGITNANLANSTISGIALGSSLNTLTATNSSLTFSGNYDGSTARTVGLNLANANSWTAAQSITNTTGPQFTLAYDGSNQTTFSIGSTGTCTISCSGSGGFVAFSQIVGLQAGFQTSNSTYSSNLVVINAQSAARNNASQIALGGATQTGHRMFMRGSSNYTMTTTDSYGHFILGAMTITEAATGTHPLVTGLAIKQSTITNAAGATTNTASFYIEDAWTGVTPTGQNYSIWSDAGINRFDGVLEERASSSSAATLTLDGTATFWVFTGTTSTWTLPSVASSVGWRYSIKNKGSGNLTVQGASSTDIYDTAAVASLTVSAGAALALRNDGTNWDKM